ncbi:hypothetical protein NKR23_g9683 [Pleurostoma richardsiae]|uniref:Uncharacterized protein n=1 Tax=Pleurostoma richardsiae TaxID=41990 RepID=A0AA38R6I8_9PEZI|nr:hypothetical protein NKR23_g9683 [Pleurostoma richardsiae]
MRSFIAATAVALLAGAAIAENSTVNLFINDDMDGDAGYVASVVSACADETVYAIQCTSGPVGPATCGPDAPILTLTEGPAIYEASIVTKSSANGVDATVSVWESCKLDGTTAATCSASVSVKANGQQTATATQTVLSGTDYHRFQVAITAGAEKTASATGSCGAGDSGSAAPGRNVRFAAASGLLAAVGAAALLIL